MPALRANTTWHLVEDIERLRIMAGLERWLVFGGSWGSTLALAYAETYPTRVTELILRGRLLPAPLGTDLVTIRRALPGCSRISGSVSSRPFRKPSVATSSRPIAPIPEAERGDLITAYHRRLTGSSPAAQIEAAKAWSLWEGETITLLPNPAFTDQHGEDAFALAFARIENHYFFNDGFMTEGQLIDNAGRLRDIPGIIVQGRYDIATPVKTAWDLHRAWPEAEFHPGAGRWPRLQRAGILDQLLLATDRFAA